MEFKETSLEIVGTKVDQILMTDENGTVWIVPEDPANSDYQSYLKWKSEQEEVK